MDILHRKTETGDAIGKGRCSGDRPFEKSSHLLVESPIKKALFSTIQPDLSFLHAVAFELKSCIFFNGDVLLLSGRKTF